MSIATQKHSVTEEETFIGKVLTWLTVVAILMGGSYGIGVIHGRHTSNSYMLIQQAYNDGLANCAEKTREDK